VCGQVVDDQAAIGGPVVGSNTFVQRAVHCSAQGQVGGQVQAGHALATSHPVVSLSVPSVFGRIQDFDNPDSPCTEGTPTV
jgi:hypothetical protein